MPLKFVENVEPKQFPIAISVYSKEELFCIIQLGKHLNVKVDINPHKFPILEVMSGNKEVFVTFEQSVGLSILVLDNGTAKDILKKRSLQVISVMEFFSYMGESFEMFTKRTYQERQAKHTNKLGGIININGNEYPASLIEEIMEISIDDFLLNLDYEMTIIEKNYDNGNN